MTFYVFLKIRDARGSGTPWTCKGIKVGKLQSGFLFKRQARGLV